MYKKRKWFLAQIRGHSAAANGHQSSSGQVRGRSKEPRLGGDPHFSQELHLGELRAIVSYVYIASLSQGNIMPSSSYRYIYIYTPQTKTWSRGSMQATQAVLDSTHKQCSTQLPSSARHSRQNGHGRRRLPCKAVSQPIFGQHITYTYICREIPMRPPFG